MIKLTLYEKCILNENYKEVMSPGIKSTTIRKSILDLYLDGLLKYEIEIDGVYQVLSGIFVFPFEIENKNIYSYNYLKIEDESNNIKRYAFIESIELKNGLVYLSYNEDIWSSYSSAIKGCTFSQLDRSRILDYGNNLKCKYHNIPEDYKGNNGISYQKLDNIDQNSEFIILFEFQPYIENGFFGISYRESFVAAVKVASYTKVFETIGYLEAASQSKSCTISLAGLSPTSLFFGINRIAVISKSYFEFLPFEDLFELSHEFYIQYDVNHVTLFHTPIYVPTLSAWNSVLDIVPYVLLKSYDIQNNFKNISIGTLFQTFETDNNGTNFQMRFGLSVSRYTFNFYIDYNNNLIDITDSFIVDFPIKYMDGNEKQSLKIAKNLGIINGSAKVASGLFDATTDIISAKTNGLSLLGTNAQYISKQHTRKTKKGWTKKRVTEKIPGKMGVGEFFEDGSDIISGISDVISSTLPLLNTTKGAHTETNGVINAIFGFVIYKINSDNDNIIKDLINNTGYIVYNFVSNFNELKILNPVWHRNKNINYNIIKFNYVDLYGSFPRNIANTLNNILENGIKIWYDENLTEDNYVV